MKTKLLSFSLSLCLLLTCGLFLVGCDLFGNNNNNNKKDDVNTYIETTLTDIAATWEQLGNDYDLTSYQTEYEEIRANIGKATKKTDVDGHKTRFNELVEKVKQNNQQKPDEFTVQKDTVLANVKQQWEILYASYPELKNNPEYLTAYEALLNNFKAAKNQNDLYEVSQNFGNLIQQITQNLTIDVTAYRGQAKKYAEDTWANLLKEYSDLATNTGFTARYNELTEALKKAETEQAVNEVMGNFGTLFNEIAENYKPVEKVTEEQINALLSQIDTQWKTLCEQYPALSQSDFAKKYENLKGLLKKAETEADLETIRQKFDELLNEVKNNFQDDLSSYKEQTRRSIENKWQDLVQRYNVPVEQSLTAQYDEILSNIEAAENKAAVDEAAEPAEQLLQVVSAYLELEETRQACLTEYMNAWNDLENEYRDRITQEMRDKYDELVAATNGATTPEGVRAGCQKILDYVEKLRNELSQQGGEVEKVTEEQINALLSQIDTQWKTLCEQYPALSQSDFAKKYENLKGLLKKAETEADLETIRQKFDELLNEVKNNFQDDLSSYKEQTRRSIENKWQDLVQRYNVPVEQSLTAQYDEILSNIEAAENKAAVDEAAEPAEQLLQVVSAYLELEETRQACLTEYMNAWNDLENEYRDRITQEMRDKYDELVAATNGATTPEGVRAGCQKILDYVEKLRNELSQQGGEDLTSLKSQLQNNIFESLLNIQESCSNNGFSIEWSKEITDKQTALLQQIDDAKTRAAIEAIQSTVENEFYPMLKSYAIESVKTQLKKEFAEQWAAHEKAHSEYTDLYNQYVEIIDLPLKTTDVYDVLSNYEYLKNSVLADFINSFTYEDDMRYLRYCNITGNFYDALDNELKKAYSSEFSRWVDKLKSVMSLEEAKTQFANFKKWLAEIKQKPYVKSVELIQNKLTLTVGVTEEQITEALNKISAKVTYSDQTETTLSFAEGTYSLSGHDFTKVGSYYVSATFTIGDSKYSEGITVIIAPDMTGAKELATYRGTGSLDNKSTITLYDNGYAMDNNGFYAKYERYDDYCAIYAENTVMLCRPDDSEKTIDLYVPSDDSLVGTFVYQYMEKSPFRVYKHVKSDKYIVTLQEHYEDKIHTLFSTFCDFDAAKRTLVCAMIDNYVGSYSDETVTYTWDEGSNVLRIDVSGKITAMQKEWQVLITQGYDVSYFENDYNNIIFNLQNSSGGMIQDYVNQFTNLVERVKSNHYMQEEWQVLITQGYDVSYFENDYNDIIFNIQNSSTMIQEYVNQFTSLVESVKRNRYTRFEPSFAPFYELKVGDDIEEFIKKNLIGKTCTAYLEWSNNPGKTVTITRDMITYEGDTKTSGGFSIRVSYVDKLYANSGDSFFEVYVNVFDVPVAA